MAKTTTTSDGAVSWHARRYEQAWFAKYLDDCAVIGTEIGDASAPARCNLT